MSKLAVLLYGRSQRRSDAVTQRQCPACGHYADYTPLLPKNPVECRIHIIL